VAEVGGERKKGEQELQAGVARLKNTEKKLEERMNS